MRLKDILAGIECDIKGNADIEINDLKYDSRQVHAGDLFFCISGFEQDGHKYAPDAVKNGAAALLVTREIAGLNAVQVLVKNDRQAMAAAAVRFFGNPAASIKTVGVTGTNGKTTTTYMVKSIAEAAGMKVGLIGTICNMIGEGTLPTERTTPESVDL